MNDSVYCESQFVEKDFHQRSSAKTSKIQTLMSLGVWNQLINHNNITRRPFISFRGKAMSHWMLGNDPLIKQIKQNKMLYLKLNAGEKIRQQLSYAIQFESLENVRISKKYFFTYFLTLLTYLPCLIRCTHYLGLS